jgi:hypothetical protein
MPQTIVESPVDSQFGDWAVIGPPERRRRASGKAYTAFPVQCSCGATSFVASAELRRGNSLRCSNCRYKTRKYGSKNYTDSGSWLGGPWKTTTNGYHAVSMPAPNKGRQHTYLYEHVLVMERFLGRALLPVENVHHKNGVKTDNRLDNLELWVTSQPRGQRPEDLVLWAKEILARYDEN